MSQKARTSPFLWKIQFSKHDRRGGIDQPPSLLSKDNLSFVVNFRQIKIIMIFFLAYKCFFTICFSSNMVFFFQVTIKQIQKPKLSTLDIFDTQCREMWSLAFVTWMIDLSLFLDAPILKLRIIIIILPTDQLEINLLIVPTAIN